MNPRMTILGTGSAIPLRNYNSCFVLQNSDFVLLSDAGGGNGIFSQLQQANVALSALTHFVISHSHTDHILGAVWIVRSRILLAKNGVKISRLHVYANATTARALIEICRLTFLDSYFSMFDDVIDLHIASDGDVYKIGNSTINFFDVMSENVDQIGFKILFDNGVSLVSLGDEALTESNCNSSRGADYLICGAFCRYADRHIFHPYEKHHLTVRDVAAIADKSDIKHLIIYHSEDASDDKQKNYTAEASQYFKGHIIIPSDLDSFILST